MGKPPGSSRAVVVILPGELLERIASSTVQWLQALLQNVRVRNSAEPRGPRAGFGARTRLWITSVLTAVIVSLLGLGSPAFGHAELISSSPKSGANLDTAPKSVSFKFGEKLMSRGNAITATDTETGIRLKLGAVKVDGRKLSVGWPKSAPAGQYRVAYRAVSADGHPITGRIVFTYSQPSPAAVAEPAPTALPDQNPAPTADPARTTDTAAALGITPLEYPVNSSALVWIVLAGFLGLVVAGGAALSTSRRAR